jgi:predicted small secreted protein
MTNVSTVSQQGLRKLILALAVAGFSAAALSACNTVEGAGKDIESTGDAIQDSADD